MRSYFFLLNYYAHDFFSAMWLASFATISVIHVKSSQNAQSLAESALISDLLHLFLQIQLASLLLIMVTGYGRFLDSRGKLQQEGERPRRDLLIIKHLLMGIVFLGGSYLGYRWAY
jgi:hypothetical protein